MEPGPPQGQPSPRCPGPGLQGRRAQAGVRLGEQASASASVPGRTRSLCPRAQPVWGLAAQLVSPRPPRAWAGASTWRRHHCHRRLSCPRGGARCEGPVGAAAPDSARVAPAEHVHRHLERHEVRYLQFAFRWMNNLLTRELPLRCAVRLWDTYQVSPPSPRGPPGPPAPHAPAGRLPGEPPVPLGPPASHAPRLALPGPAPSARFAFRPSSPAACGLLRAHF